MKYLMMMKHADDLWGKGPPPALLEAMGKFVEAAFKDGTLVDAAGLTPTKDGWQVRIKGGKVTTTDGPFTEAKEIVGGYAIVNAKSHDHARQIAQDFIELHRLHWPEFEGVSEVRPLEEQG